MMLKGYFYEKDTNWVVPIERKGKMIVLKKEHTARDKITGEKNAFSVKRVIWTQQSNDPEKIIILEEFVWESGKRKGETYFRIGYYTTAKSGAWWWGQFALMIPENDFEELLTYAREKNMLP